VREETWVKRDSYLVRSNRDICTEEFGSVYLRNVADSYSRAELCLPWNVGGGDVDPVCPGAADGCQGDTSRPFRSKMWAMRAQQIVLYSSCMNSPRFESRPLNHLWFCVMILSSGMCRYDVLLQTFQRNCICIPG
jgi:hypothetical protein